MGGGLRLTGGSNIANGRAGTPSVGPPAWSKQGTVHMLPQWATRPRICLRGRSHSLTCSELTRVYTLANTSGPLFEAELTRDDTS